MSDRKTLNEERADTALSALVQLAAVKAQQASDCDTICRLTDRLYREIARLADAIKLLATSARVSE